MRLQGRPGRLTCLIAAALGVFALAGGLVSSLYPATIQLQITHVLVALGLMAGILALANVVYNRVRGKKARSETFTSLSRIHGEIQTLAEERTAALRKLQEQDHLLKAVLGAMGQGIFWKDSQGVYRGCNERFARWMGRDKPEEVIGKTDHELLADPAKADFYIRCDSEVMKTGIGLLDMAEAVTTASGARAELLVSKLPLWDVHGGIMGVIGIGTDITDVKQTETHKDAPAGLAQTIGSMQEGVVVIDARGVIAEANDYYAALTQKPSEILRGRHICDVLTYPADNQLRDILEHFRNATGRPAAEAFHHCLGQKDFYVRVQPVCRRDRYDGAIINVIDVSELTQAKERAEYASYRKGQFLASISHQIRTPLNNIAGFAELLSQESLAPEQARFVEMIASSANSIREVVEEIVSLSRDHIEEFAEADRTSEPEGPVADKGRHREDGAETNAAAADTTPKSDDAPAVLIVDDVPENRMLLEVLLKKQGYSTIQCSSGREAAELSERNQFDLILMDIQMAEMDGFETTRTIRSKGLNVATPILAMTASSAHQDEQRCLEAGCDDFIRKPIRKEVLLRKVWRFMAQQKQMRTAEAGGDIVSFLSDNPDYQKTIETFVENLPGRIRDMQHALDTENLQDLAFKTHVLKGLGGFAGFPVYTELAKSIEQAIHDSHIEDIRLKLDEMVSLCKRTHITRQ